MLPPSPHDDGRGSVRMAVIANDAESTVTVKVGNRENEYEGQIVIGELVIDLDPGRLQGRLILRPVITLSV